MKITIEIQEDEILEEVKKLVIDKVANQIMSEYNNSPRYYYRNVIKDCVREAIKQDIDNLQDRAVAAAGKSIENRAVKKLADRKIGERAMTKQETQKYFDYLNGVADGFKISNEDVIDELEEIRAEI